MQMKYFSIRRSGPLNQSQRERGLPEFDFYVNAGCLQAAQGDASQGYTVGIWKSNLAQRYTPIHTTKTFSVTFFTEHNEAPMAVISYREVEGKVVEIQSTRLPSKWPMIESVFLPVEGVKPVDGFKQTSGQFTAEKVFFSQNVMFS